MDFNKSFFLEFFTAALCLLDAWRKWTKSSTWTKKKLNNERNSKNKCKSIRRKKKYYLTNLHKYECMRSVFLEEVGRLTQINSCEISARASKEGVNWMTMLWSFLHKYRVLGFTCKRIHFCKLISSTVRCVQAILNSFTRLLRATTVKMPLF